MYSRNESRCCVVDCWAYLTPQRISHPMPTETIRCEKWIDLLQIRNATKPMSTYRICDLHFEDDDYDTNENGMRTLKNTSVPSLKLPKLTHPEPDNKRVHVIKRKFDLPGLKVEKKVKIKNYIVVQSTKPEIKPIARPVEGIKKVIKRYSKFDVKQSPKPIARPVEGIEKVIKRKFVLKSNLPYNPNKEDPLFQIYPELEEPPVGILNVTGNGESNSSLVSYSQLDVKLSSTDKIKNVVVIKDEE